MLKNLMCVAFGVLLLVSCEKATKADKNETAQVVKSADLAVNLRTMSLDIEGMTCEIGCARTIQAKLSKTEGIKTAVVNFDKKEGIVEYDPTGTLVGIYDPVTLGGYRGVYQLPNGNILTTNGSGVHEIDRLGNLVETKISGVSARFIELVRPVVIPPQIIPSHSLNSIILLTFGLFALILKFRFKKD